MKIADNKPGTDPWEELKEYRRKLMANHKYMSVYVDEEQQLRDGIARAVDRKQKRRLKRELRFVAGETKSAAREVKILQGRIADLTSKYPSLEDGPVENVDPYEVLLHERLTRIEAKRLMENTDLEHASIWDEAHRIATERVASEPAYVTHTDLRGHLHIELPELPDHYSSCLPSESDEQAAKRQALTNAQEEASRLSAEYSRVLGEAVAATMTLEDTPEVVAAREAAVEATKRELRLRREYLGDGMKIPSTVCANCGKTFDQDRSMPGKVAGYDSPQDRCPTCARYVDGHKYPTAPVDF